MLLNLGINLFVVDQVNDISLADYIGVQAKHATYVPHTAGRYSVKRFRKAQCPIVERLTNSLQMHGRNNGKKLKAVTIIKHAMEIIHLLTDQNPVQVIVDAVVNRSVINYIFFSSRRLLTAEIISRLFEYGLFCIFFYDLLLLATRLTIFLIYNSGPREDATRIGSAGVVRRQAVDISPLRRVNQALYLLTTGAREAAFRNIKTIAECLADELINAAKGSSNRFFSFLLGCSFHNCFSVLFVIVFIFFSYAIKKKDEIERVAKANR
jgi:small subunit ribosomal protein S5e